MAFTWTAIASNAIILARYFDNINFLLILKMTLVFIF